MKARYRLPAPGAGPPPLPPRQGSEVDSHNAMESRRRSMSNPEIALPGQLLGTCDGMTRPRARCQQGEPPRPNALPLATRSPPGSTKSSQVRGSGGSLRARKVGGVLRPERKWSNSTNSIPSLVGEEASWPASTPSSPMSRSGPVHNMGRGLKSSRTRANRGRGKGGNGRVAIAQAHSSPASASSPSGRGGSARSAGSPPQCPPRSVDPRPTAGNLMSDRAMSPHRGRPGCAQDLSRALPERRLPPQAKSPPRALSPERRGLPPNPKSPRGVRANKQRVPPVAINRAKSPPLPPRSGNATSPRSGKPTSPRSKDPVSETGSLSSPQRRPPWSKKAESSPSPELNKVRVKDPCAADRRRSGSQWGEPMQGTVCAGCRKEIGPGHFVVASEKKYHPNCFHCQICKEVLCSNFFESDGAIICQYCYMKKLRKNLKRCDGCFKPLTGKFVKAGGLSLHPECFICNKCQNIISSEFFTKDGQILCDECGATPVTSTPCAKCMELISGDMLEALGQRWHPQCFTCINCDRQFPGGSYFKIRGGAYCADCVDHANATTAYGTIQPMLPAMTMKESSGNKSTRQERLRAESIKELLATEKRFIMDCELMRSAYRQQLVSNSILTTEEAAVMFANLDQVIHVATTIVNRLNEACRAPASSIQIGQVFMDKSLKFEVYAEYCLRNVRSNALFAYLLETNPEFKAFVVQMQAQEQFGGLSVDDFLIKPVQRVCRYVLLLKVILKNTEESSPDAAQLQGGIDRIDQVLQTMNSQKAEMDRERDEVSLINSALVFDAGTEAVDVKNPMRQVLSRHTVKRVLVDGKDCGARLALVCTDCFLFIKQKDKKFSCRLVLWRAACSMEFLPITSKFKFGINIIPHASETVTVVVDSADEQSAWSWIWQR